MKNKLYSILIISTLLIFFSCTNNSTESLENKNVESLASTIIKISEEQFVNSEMQLKTLSETPFYESIHCNGYVNVMPNNKASISVPMGGIISEIKVHIGTKVQKGDLLFTIENIDLLQIQQDFLEAKAQLEYLYENYQRQETFIKEKVGSQKDYLQAKSEYFVMEAKFNGLKRKLALININAEEVAKGNIFEYGNILAPITGYITNLNFTIGDFITPGENVVELINTDKLILVLNVFERDVLQIKKGQKLSFNLPELLDLTFTGEVEVIGKKISDKNGSIPVYCSINSTQNTKLIPGMFVDANIHKKMALKKSLPESSIIEVDGQNYILVLTERKNGFYFFDKTEVQIGETYQKKQEILNENISMDQKILTKGAFNIIN